jgi:O-antigen ligase
MKTLDSVSAVQYYPVRANQGYPRASNFALLLFAVYIPIWFLEIGKRIHVLGAIRFEFVLGAFLGLLAVFSIIMHAGKYRVNPLIPYIALYFFVLFVQLPFSQNFEISWQLFVDRILKFSFMALFIASFVRNPFALRVFIFMFLLSCLKIGQEAFMGKVTGSMVWQSQGVMRLNGPVGTLVGHPNSLSGNGLGTLPFIYYLFPNLSWKWRIPLLIQLLFAANIIVFTASRTGYLGFLVFCAVVFMKSKYKKHFLLFAGILAIVALLVIPTAYQERFSTIFSGQEKEGHSKQSRIELLYDSIHVFETYPLGVGIGAFRFVRERDYGKVPMDTHNLYTQILAEIGIQGLIVFVALIYKLLKTLRNLELDLKEDIRNIQSHIETAPELEADENVRKHLKDLKFIQAICSSTFAYVVVRLALGCFGHDLYEVYWWIACGLAIAMTNIYQAAIPRTEEILLYEPEYQA